MKKFLGLAVLIFFFWTVQAQAPAQNPPEKEQKAGKMKSHKDKRERGREMSDGLSNTQGEQVKEINRTYHEKIKAVKSEEGLTEQQKKEKAEAINNERQNKIKELVGTDKYNKMKEEKDDWNEEQEDKNDELNDNKEKKDKKDKKEKEKKQRGNGHKHD
jgi:hypothetical protein